MNVPNDQTSEISQNTDHRQSEITPWDQESKNIEPILDKYKFMLNNTKVSKPKILIVNQLDSILLDKELYEILKYQFNKIFSFFKEDRIERLYPELELILQLILYRISIWSKGYTHGQELQNIKYKSLSKTQKILYLILSIFVPYLMKRWWAIYSYFTKTESDNPPRKITTNLHRIERFYQVLTVLNFLVFLYNGRYVTPIHRLLNMEHSYINKQMIKRVSFEFMNRQLVWNGFTEFMMFIVPMIPIASIKKKIHSFSNLSLGFLFRNAENKKQNEYVDAFTCGICKSHANVAHETNCGHIFCYFCIKTEMMNDPTLPCPVCGKKVTLIKRCTINQ